MALLVCLAEVPGRVWTRDELFHRLWEGRFVSENSLTNAVSDLRRALGDTRGMVETVRKVGYRLTESRKPLDRLDVRRSSAGEGRTARSSWRLGLAAAILLAVLLPLAAQVWRVPLDARRVVTVTEEAVPSEYLASLPLGRRGAPNTRGVDLLRRVVVRQPTFAPAWSELSLRLYYRAWDERQPRRWLEEAEAAAQSALELDPDELAAARQLVVLKADRGELAEALALARRMAERSPRSYEARFALSYAYRYTGSLERAAAECSEARSLNAAAPILRSCAVVFYRLGRFAQARAFLDLDQGTQWASHQEAMVRLFEGRVAAAALAFRRLPEDSLYNGLLESCESSETGRFAELERRVSGSIDPEAQWETAALLAACGWPEKAARLLELAADRGYCAEDALEGGAPFGNLAATAAGRRAADGVARCRAELGWFGT